MNSDKNRDCCGILILYGKGNAVNIERDLLTKVEVLIRTIQILSNERTVLEHGPRPVVAPALAPALAPPSAALRPRSFV